MSKNKNTANEIKKLLNQLFAVAKIKFMDTPLSDGSTLRTPDDTLVQGSQVTIVTSDGTETPAPDGEVTLQDGSKVTIKGGVVDAIAPGSDASTDAKPEDIAQDADLASGTGPKAKTDMDDMPPADDSMGDVATILGKIMERLEALEAAASANSKSVSAMKSDFQKFKKEPGALPIDKTPEKKEELKFGSAAWREQELKEITAKRKNSANTYRTTLEKELEAARAGKLQKFSIQPKKDEQEPRSGGDPSLGDMKMNSFGFGKGMSFSSDKI